MPLNWKEIGLILEEADLTGSKIQNVIQSSFHSVTWLLYSREKGRFGFYSEVGTPDARIHLLSQGASISKTKKLQRFEQFARKNLEGSVIVSSTQLPFDRVVVWELENHGRKMKIFIRLYSGNGANIIVTDSENRILDLLLRRPGRDETSGELLIQEERTSDPGVYEIRPYEGSFNSFIENSCTRIQEQSQYESLVKSAGILIEHEKERIRSSIRSLEKTIEENSSFEDFRYIADLLSANTFNFKRGDSSVTLNDYSKGTSITIALNPSLTPGDNTAHYYEKYRKAKGSWENAKTEKEKLEKELSYSESAFEKLLTPSDNIESDIRRIKAFLDRTSDNQKTGPDVGLRCTSGGFELLIGRNAKENDELLRHCVKGSDLWFHTRDFPGGYVFVKFRKDKTVPLEVMLDAANIAVLFSKGRNNKKVDLYYTQVKYLRRVKDGKKGLVIPSQEKNLTIEPDESRVKKLLNENCPE